MSQVEAESSVVKEIVEEDENTICDITVALAGVNLQKDTNEPFPFLELPDDLIRYAYHYFNPAIRRALRANGRLERIEKEVKYRYDTLDVKMEKDRIILSCDGGEYDIPHTEVEKEFELLGETTHFDEVNFKADRSLYRRQNNKEIDYSRVRFKLIRSVFRQSVDMIYFLKAKKLCTDDERLDDENLENIVQNKEEIIIKDSDLDDGYVWIYENMRDRQLDLKFVKIESSELEERANFMNKLGSFHMDYPFFYTLDPNLEVVRDTDSVTITEGRLKIIVNGLTRDSCEFDSQNACCYQPNEPGFVSFEINEDDKGDSK